MWVWDMRYDIWEAQEDSDTPIRWGRRISIRTYLYINIKMEFQHFIYFILIYLYINISIYLSVYLFLSIVTIFILCGHPPGSFHSFVLPSWWYQGDDTQVMTPQWWYPVWHWADEAAADYQHKQSADAVNSPPYDSNSIQRLDAFWRLNSTQGPRSRNLTARRTSKWFLRMTRNNKHRIITI